METSEQIISDEQIEAAWGNASFGKDTSKREVVANAMLKYACDYCTGHTIECICRELGLITKMGRITTLGKQFLFATLSHGLSV